MLNIGLNTAEYNLGDSRISFPLCFSPETDIQMLHRNTAMELAQESFEEGLAIGKKLFICKCPLMDPNLKTFMFPIRNRDEFKDYIEGQRHNGIVAGYLEEAENRGY